MRPSWASGGRVTHLKILTAMYSSPGMFVVRADSPYKTIRDLVGQPIAFGAKGSGLPILSRYMLDGLGLKQDEDFKSVYLDHAGDGPAMVLDGRVAALWGAGIGWPGFTTMASSPGGARFIAPDAEEIARDPRQARVPQADDRSGRQLSEPELRRSIRWGRGVSSWRAPICPTMSPIGWRRTLHGAESAFCKKLAQACETTAANTLAAAPERGADSSRRAEVFPRDRGGEVTCDSPYVVPAKRSASRDP